MYVVYGLCDLEFEKDTFIHKQISRKIADQISTKGHRDRDLLMHLEPVLPKCNNESVLVNRFYKAAAQLIVYLIKGPNYFLRKF